MGGGINTSTPRISPQAERIAGSAKASRQDAPGRPSAAYPPVGWYGAVTRIGTIVSPQWMRSTA
jgi:hypothetical protein